MIKPLQAEATIAREQHDHLFEDLLDRCVEEPAPVPVGELLNRLDTQRQNSEQILDGILHDIRDARRSTNKCLDRFDTIVKKTTPKNSTGWLRADVEWRYTDGTYFHDSYKTLALIGKSSFVKWPLAGLDGKTRFKILSRFCFYPALITESMRMVFVRATKGQITYMRDGAEQSAIKFIGKTPFKTSVYFPKENTRHRNIIITLERVPGSEICGLEFLFDGEQFHLVDIISIGAFYDKGFEALVRTELIDCPKALGDFLRHCFEPFRCGRLRIHHKNLEDYLSHIWYKVGLAEAVGTSFLIIQKDDRRL